MSTGSSDIVVEVKDDAPVVCFVEPFFGGSHAQLEPYLRAAATCSRARFVSCTLPPRKWGWRLAAGAVWAASVIPRLPRGSTLFVSAMLNVAELLGLRCDLCGAGGRGGVRVVVYVHENQLEYPVRGGGGVVGVSIISPAGTRAAADGGEKEWARGWAQLMSVLSADCVIFNSSWNLDSFAARVPALLKVIPGAEQRPDASAVIKAIYARAIIVGVPLPRPPPQTATATAPTTTRLRVAWPHRWEYDKAPQTFFDAILAPGVDCEVLLLGQAFAGGGGGGGFNRGDTSSSTPGADCADFAGARAALEAAGRVVCWGGVTSRSEYLALLASADVVCSTAIHEFFGVSTVEGILSGAYPLVPDGLSYAELIMPDAREIRRPRALRAARCRTCSAQCRLRSLRKRRCAARRTRGTPPPGAGSSRPCCS